MNLGLTLCYLHHHGVFKSNSTTLLLAVLNASSKIWTGYSFKELWMRTNSTKGSAITYLKLETICLCHQSRYWEDISAYFLSGSQINTSRKLFNEIRHITYYENITLPCLDVVAYHEPHKKGPSHSTGYGSDNAWHFSTWEDQRRGDP